MLSSPYVVEGFFKGKFLTSHPSHHRKHIKKVHLYQNCYFNIKSGTHVKLPIGKYDVDKTGLPDKSLSSIKIPKGLKITLYDSPGFTGNSIVLDHTYTTNQGRGHMMAFEIGKLGNVSCLSNVNGQNFLGKTSSFVIESTECESCPTGSVSGSTGSGSGSTGSGGSGGSGTTDATCLVNSSETSNFNQYVAKCRQSIDTSRANNFFSQSISQFKDIFQQLRSQYDNLIVSGDSQNTMATLSGNTMDGVNKQLRSLKKEKDELLYKVKKEQNQAQSADRMFLDDIMHGKEQEQVYPSLQDFSLGLFFFGWIVMCFVLMYIRGTSPGGGVMAVLMTFMLLVVISGALYSLLSYIA